MKLWEEITWSSYPPSRLWDMQCPRRFFCISHPNLPRRCLRFTRNNFRRRNILIDLQKLFSFLNFHNIIYLNINRLQWFLFTQSIFIYFVIILQNQIWAASAFSHTFLNYLLSLEILWNFKLVTIERSSLRKLNFARFWGILIG